MRPTNYHLFDFMDFDTDLKRDESLWKAYKPTSVREKDGDILVEVPFQKQQLANDMAPDTDVPQETQTLVIRQYEPGILRLFMGCGGRTALRHLGDAADERSCETVAAESGVRG